MSWFWMILIGAVAGWLAGVLTRGRGFGFLVNALIGVIGSVLGRWTFDKLDIHISGSLGVLAAATVGALLLIGIANLFTGRD